MSETTLAALLVALVGFGATIVVALLKIWKGTDAIHVLVNSNLSRVRMDLRLVLGAVFVVVLVFMYKDSEKRRGK